MTTTGLTPNIWKTPKKKKQKTRKKKMPRAHEKFLFDDFDLDVPEEVVLPVDLPEFDPVYDDDLWWTADDEESIDELLEDSN